MSDRPPYIADQRMRLQTADDRRPFLMPDAFRGWRAEQDDSPRRAGGEQDPWRPVDRDAVALDRLRDTEGKPVSLRRLVVTSDAGLGKTTTLSWILHRNHQPDSRNLAFGMALGGPMSAGRDGAGWISLAGTPPANGDGLIAEVLAPRVARAVQNPVSGLEDRARQLIVRLREQGRLVLLFDALDQADGAAVRLLQDLLGDRRWEACRIVVAGRPPAIQRFWPVLFDNQIDWRYLEVDQFTAAQQRAYLGKDASGRDRYDRIPDEALQILGLPRVLEHLRRLPDDRWGGIRAIDLQEAVEKFDEEDAPRAAVRQYQRASAAQLGLLDRTVPLEQLYQTLPLLRKVEPVRLPREPRADGNPGADEVATRGEELVRWEEEVRGEPGADEVATRGEELVRWEEEVRGERVTFQRHTLEDVFSNFRGVVPEAKTRMPRFVVLGPPGSGKTTLQQYLAYRAARGELRSCGRQLLPTRVRLREWQAWAVKPSAPDTGLPEYLAYRYKDLAPAPTVSHWRRWLRDGEVLLLLDGLDEIDAAPGFGPMLKAALAAFEACPAALTCRTVSYDQHQMLCQDFPVFALAGFDDSQRDRYVRTYPAKHAERYRPEALIDQLSRMPQMHPLAANPLLLSLICFLVDDPRGVALPATRGELYDRAVSQLLLCYKSHPRVQVAYPSAPPDVEEKRVILERAALVLFAGQREKLTFSGKHLKECLRQSLADLGYGQATAPWANALRDDLVANSGLLRADDKEEYFFLHLTIEEFLTASALAQIIDDQGGLGWESELTLEGRRRTVREFLDRKAWDPRWQEVICLLAGRLKDPLPLLEMLADPAPTPTNPEGDDFFGHRRALAALCRAEIPASVRSDEVCQRQIDRITAEVVSPRERHSRDGTGATDPHIYRALPALDQVNGRMPKCDDKGEWTAPSDRDTTDGQTSVRLLDPLAELFHRKLHYFGQRELKSLAAGAMARLRAATAATPPVPEGLLPFEIWPEAKGSAISAIDSLCVAPKPSMLEWLAHWLIVNGDVSQSAAKAIDKLGAAARPVVLERLAAYLHGDGDAYERTVSEIRSLCGSAFTSVIAEILAELLRHPDRDVQKRAARAICQLGAAAATPPILERLAELLPDEEDCARGRSVAEAIADMGAAAATPPMLERLAELLRHPDCDVQDRAVFAIGGLGVAAATPPMLERLAELLRHPDRNMQASAVRTIGDLGPAAATHPILEGLAELLRHPDPRDPRPMYTRHWVVEAIGRLGPVAATPPMLEQLAELLRHPDRDVQRWAAEAIGELRGAVAAPPMFTWLAELLRDANEESLVSVAEAIGELGTAAATPPILEWLAELLRHPDRDVLHSALAAIRRLGAVAATPPILEGLAELLRHPDRDVLRWAVEVIGCLPVAATLPMLERLAALLRHPDCEVQESAVGAVGRLGAAAATPPMLERLAELLRHPDDDVQHSAAGAICGLGAAAATLPILDGLAELLRHPHRHEHFPPRCLKRRVLETIRALSAAATPPMLERLAQLLRHADWWVRHCTVEAIGDLGTAAATRPMLAQLAELLRDANEGSRESAAEAIGRLGAEAVTPPILERLPDLLRHANKDLKCSACNAIDGLGAAAATSPILEALAELLCDTGLPAWATRTAGRLGAAAATPPILEGLAQLLRDRQWYSRNAVEAIRALGAAAATPPILEGLAELLRDAEDGWQLRPSTAKAIGGMGGAAATPPIVEPLAVLLQDADASVRSWAAKAIDDVLGVRLRLFQRPTDQVPAWRILKVEDLSR